MTNSKRRTMPAVVAGALGLGAFAACAGAAETSQSDLRNQVSALQAQVSAMEAAKTANSADVKAVADSMVADADAHSKFLDMAGGMAGHDDDGFMIGDAKGWNVHAWAGAQIRYAANYGRHRKNGGSDLQAGFEVTRMRLALSGNVGDPSLKYSFVWDAGDLTGGTGLLDANVAWQATDQVVVGAGQFIDPLNKEALVSPFMQPGVDRSLLNETLGTPEGPAGRVQGAWLAWGGKADAFHVIVAITDGFGTANTNFQDNGVNFGVVGRVEFVVPMGGNTADAWNAVKTLTAHGIANNTSALVIGAAADATQGDNFTAYHFTADGQWVNSNGFNVLVAFDSVYNRPRNALGTTKSFNWGFLGQVAYAVPSSQVELFGRFDWTHFQRINAIGNKNLLELTGGVTYYLGNNGSLNNHAKVTADVTWLPKGALGQGSVPTEAYLDIIGGTKNTEIVGRVQLQVAL